MSDNPYHSPSQPDAVNFPANADRSQHIFILLGFAISGGLLSYAPWLGCIFIALSAPLFFRFYLLRTDPAATRLGAVSRAAQIAGIVGMALSVVAASAGTFFGTCTLTSYVVGLPLIVRAGARRQTGELEVNLAIQVGVVVGLIAAAASLAWLYFYFRRMGQRPLN